ncbi:hypothetical protein HK098_004200 [Nowakowskiella sp. JEL0407]|nr:hypothetical protein HK098_004200 [Nowakowskiella sp. JEL0407]
MAMLTNVFQNSIQSKSLSNSKLNSSRPASGQITSKTLKPQVAPAAAPPNQNPKLSASSKGNVKESTVLLQPQAAVVAPNNNIKPQQIAKTTNSIAPQKPVQSSQQVTPQPNIEEKNQELVAPRQPPSSHQRVMSTQQGKMKSANQSSQNQQNTQPQPSATVQKMSKSSISAVVDEEIPDETHNIQQNQIPAADVIEEKYSYNDDDFEEYNDDFEDFEVEETSHEIAMLRKAMDEENKRASSGKHLQSPQKGNISTNLSENKNITPLSENVIGQPKAAVTKETKKPRQISFAERQRMQRAEDLSKLIELDIANYTIFDKPPLTEYELYIRSFGSSNHTQVQTQTNEDQSDRETQTDDWLIEDKCIQASRFDDSCTVVPPSLPWLQKQKNEYQGDEMFEKYKEMESWRKSGNWNDLRLGKFLRKASMVVESLLEECSLNSSSLVSFQTGNNSIGISQKQSFLAERSFLQGREIQQLLFSPNDTRVLLVSWSPVTSKTPTNSPLSPYGVICLWRLTDTSFPFRILVCEDTPTSCCFGTTKPHLIFAGTESGSVLVWDTQSEPTHSTIPTNLTFQKDKSIINIPVQFPSYSTDWVCSGSNLKKGHFSSILSVIYVAGSDSGLSGRGGDGLENKVVQIVSVDRDATLNYWTLIEIKDEKISSLEAEQDFGMWVGSKIKLVGSNCINIHNPDKFGMSPQIVINDFKLQPNNLDKFIAAADIGMVIQGSRYRDYCYPRSYHLKHSLSGIPVCSIDYNLHPLRFQSKDTLLFLAGYKNGTISLFISSDPQPIYQWNLDNCQILKIKWSPHRPSVFYVLEDTSSLHIFDLLGNTIGPSFTVKIPNCKIVDFGLSPTAATQPSLNLAMSKNATLALAVFCDGKFQVQIHLQENEWGEMGIDEDVLFVDAPKQESPEVIKNNKSENDVAQLTEKEEKKRDMLYMRIKQERMKMEALDRERRLREHIERRNRQKQIKYLKEVIPDILVELCEEIYLPISHSLIIREHRIKYHLIEEFLFDSIPETVRQFLREFADDHLNKNPPVPLEERIYNDLITEFLNFELGEIVKTTIGGFITLHLQEQHVEYIYENILHALLLDMEIVKQSLDELFREEIYDEIVEETINSLLLRIIFETGQELNRPIYIRRQKKNPNRELLWADTHVHPEIIRKTRPHRHETTQQESYTVNLILEKYVDRLILQRLSQHFVSHGEEYIKYLVTQRIQDGMIMRALMRNYSELHGLGVRRLDDMTQEENDLVMITVLWREVPKTKWEISISSEAKFVARKMSDSDYDEDMWEEDDYEDPEDDDQVDETNDEYESENEEDAMENSGFTDVVPDSEIQRIYNVDFALHSTSDIVSFQEKEIKHVATILGCLEEHAGTLLRYFKWNKERLLESYIDNSDAICESAGVILNEKNQPKIMAVDGFCCDICCFDEPGLETLALSCGHRFCRNCYEHYLTQKISLQGECRKIQCMQSSCGVIVDRHTVEILVPPVVFSKYQNLLVRTYVDDNPHYRWCPAPNCDYAVQCAISQSQLHEVVPVVTCACGTRFCHGCGLTDHQPCICELVKLWLKKCADDSETANWIHANTKECSKCNSTIEKNGGCNHMTCRKCKYEFCWVCQGPWAEHGTSWYNCNRFDEKNSIDARDQQALSRQALERYLHYYNRYANHEQSAKLDKELYEKTEIKMDEMQKTSVLSWIEVQFLKKAVEVLLQSRNTLKWTYSFAYYLKRNNTTEIFEDNQKDLEMAVEQLSEMLESQIVPEKIGELKQNVLDKTQYVSARREVLLSDTCKGLQDGRWEYNVELKKL